MGKSEKKNLGDALSLPGTKIVLVIVEFHGLTNALLISKQIISEVEICVLPK